MQNHIQITETLQRIFTIQANTEEEAFQKVRALYKNEIIVLDASDYMDTEYELWQAEEATDVFWIPEQGNKQAVVHSHTYLKP